MGWRLGWLLRRTVLCASACLVPAAAAHAATGFVPAETLAATGAAASVVQTAMAPNGFAIAAWVESIDATHSAIRVATRPPGGPWSTPQQLDPTDLTQVRYPLSVAIDLAGDAAIAWDDEQGGSSTVDTAAVATRAAGQSSFGAAEKLTGAVDPVVGIDATGRVTMIDEELDGGSTDEVDRVWPASGSLPAFRTDLLATGCRPELVPAVLAVAPGGDAVAGAQCSGDTFVRRISGAWNPKTTPAADTSSGGPCPISPPTSSHGQDMTVAIDSAGDVAGAFVEDGSSTDCFTFMSSNSYSLNLVTGTATGVSLAPSPVDTAFSLGIATGSSITAPAIAVAPGTELLAWGNGSLLATNLLARFFDSAGNPTSAPETLVTAPFGVDPRVAMNADGMALAVFPTADGSGLQAQTRLPGMSTFLQSVPLAPAPASDASVAIDDTGDGLVGYEAGQTTSATAQVRGFDANAPSLDAASIPSSATAGAPVTFTAHASDTWGPVTLSWDFDDGSAIVTGPSVAHTFAKARGYTVAVTASDAIGNTATRTGSISVSASRPLLTRLAIKPKRFRAGHKAVFSFTLNESAKVSITIAAGKHRHRRKHHSKAAGKLTATGVSGVNHVRFTGRIGKRRLAPGRYRATIVAAEGSAQSKPARLSFTILPAG